MATLTGSVLTVKIPYESSILEATLSLPGKARGVILFAHGSGSSRFSPRNRYVAQKMVDRGFAALLLDLLTEAEEAIDFVTAELRFDIPFLSRRLTCATDWLGTQETVGELPVGYFGASTGAAAALHAAAGDGRIKAVVSRGGRPDLAKEALAKTTAAVLLVVGGNDPVVIDLNRRALALLTATQKSLEIVPRATHLFEEPGALDEVARLAIEWFSRHLV